MATLLARLQEFLLSLPGWAGIFIGLALLLVIAVISDVIFKVQVIRIVRRISERTDQTWDDALIENKVAARLAQILPAVVFYFGLTLVPGLPEVVVTVGENVAVAYALLMLSLAASAFLSAVNSIYEQYPISRERPIKGFLQVAKIVVFGFTCYFTGNNS